jgi:dienelactone hydrolase
LNDVIRGISFARSFKDYPIDLTGVVITGHSVGGHLVLLARRPSPRLWGGTTGRILLLQEDGDNVVSLSQASNTKLEHLIVKGAGHFDWIHPKTYAFQLFLLQRQDLFNP